MTNNINLLYIKPKNLRPDFRLLITWLWNDNENVDSDGNADNPASTEWTELNIRHREDSSLNFDIQPLQTNPLILEIKSTSTEMLYKVAYFMLDRTDGELSDNLEFEPLISKTYVKELIQPFSTDEADNRVNNSRYLHTTILNPYPKL
ncbi:hypothetical protein GGR28_003441 [Lewinella aquimaris]|uniref:Uncharacterized protein n=1 Tax=Neolewinella aquimaris TaxID=1835722 RepID=A0A840EIU1_9BACT|nr:hypothetical protein [Neolewinella aquimaris]MBB4080806.1 hypothetical protein [Neolewinella aquimaris]